MRNQITHSQVILTQIGKWTIKVLFLSINLQEWLLEMLAFALHLASETNYQTTLPRMSII